MKSVVLALICSLVSVQTFAQNEKTIDREELIRKELEEIGDLKANVAGARAALDEVEASLREAVGGRWITGGIALGTAGFGLLTYYLARLGAQRGGHYDFSGMFRLGAVITGVGTLGGGFWVYLREDEIADLRGRLEELEEELAAAEEALNKKEKEFEELFD